MSQDIDQAIAAVRRRKWLNKHTQSDIARLTGVDQSQISRILSGHCRRMGGALQKLCKYAEQGAGGGGSVESADAAEHSELMNALHVAWDGTDEGAKKLARLLLAISDLRDPK